MMADDDDVIPVVAFGDDDHILGVWFVAFKRVGDVPPTDILATLWRPRGAQCYRATTRLRYDAGTPDPLDDHKVSKTTEIHASDGREATAIVDGIMRGIVEDAPADIALPLQYVRIGGDSKTLMRKLRGRSWVQILPMSHVHRRKPS